MDICMCMYVMLEIHQNKLLVFNECIYLPSSSEISESHPFLYKKPRTVKQFCHMYLGTERHKLLMQQRRMKWS